MCSISLFVHTSVLSIVCPQDLDPSALVEVVIAYGDQTLLVPLAPEKTLRDARAAIAVETTGTPLHKDLALLRFLREIGSHRFWVGPGQEDKVLLSACLSTNTYSAKDFIPELVVKLDVTGYVVPVEEPTDRPVEEPTDGPVEEPTDGPVEEPTDVLVTPTDRPSSK